MLSNQEGGGIARLYELFIFTTFVKLLMGFVKNIPTFVQSRVYRNLPIM